MVSESEVVKANETAVRRMQAAQPVLTDVGTAGDVVPELDEGIVLTSGPTLPWSEYEGGQRQAVMGAVLYEGWADTTQVALKLLDSGDVRVAGCQDYGCIGSLAGVYTSSMPVFVVEDPSTGVKVHSSLYEGDTSKRLNYGMYDEDVKAGLDFLRDVAGPVLREAVARSGGVELKPIMVRSVHMGDELHSRNTAATMILFKHLAPFVFREGQSSSSFARSSRFWSTASSWDYFFLRLSMAAAKVMADSGHGAEPSTVVTNMTMNGREFAIKVSSLGPSWFKGPLPTFEALHLFDDAQEDQIAWFGGESMVTETAGLGAFAQAAAFALQRYQGGSSAAMLERNEQMYDITVTENDAFKIPIWGYRGTPTGIDIRKVVATGTTPVMDIGIAGRDGGQIGAGVARAAIDCFGAALQAHEERFGHVEQPR